MMTLRQTHETEIYDRDSYGTPYFISFFQEKLCFRIYLDILTTKADGVKQI